MARLFILLCFGLGCFGCRSGNNTQSASQTEKTALPAPEFNADSAYRYVAEQVAFGPRVPNTPAHRAAAAYLSETLSRFGAEVTVQEAPVRAFDGTLLEARNIVGSFAPEKRNRVLLFAHWDSRPFADQDPDPANHRKPISGANDGASGVGVLLEIARQLQMRQPAVGVDILFFDAEDYGKPYFYQGPDNESWALGSQYWSKRPHREGYRARYGILLDMVGGRDALFTREGYSSQFAPEIADKVWETARKLGYGKYFLPLQSGFIVDDHLYVNNAGIPSIDIIDYHPANRNGFNDRWHTLDDTLDGIDPQTLKAVGQTVLTVLFAEP